MHLVTRVSEGTALCGLLALHGSTHQHSLLVVSPPADLPFTVPGLRYDTQRQVLISQCRLADPLRDVLLEPLQCIRPSSAQFR